MACSDCKDSPSALEVAGNLIMASSRVVAAVASGSTVKAQPETVEARRAVCLACEFCQPWEKDPAYHRCGKCGCWLDGKYFAKLTLATERCPVGKWEVEK